MKYISYLPPIFLSHRFFYKKKNSVNYVVFDKIKHQYFTFLLHPLFLLFYCTYISLPKIIKNIIYFLLLIRSSPLRQV